MDEAILRALNGTMQAPAMAAIAIFLSSVWMLLLVTIPLGAVLLKRKKWFAIASIALAMGSADAINSQIIKPVVARERPCRALADLTLPAKCGVGRSFASGHAAISFAFFVSAGGTVRAGWILFGIVATMVASSRIFLGVHYPSDVVAGAALGAMIGAFYLFVRMRLELRTSNRSRRPYPRETNGSNDLPP